MNLVKGISIDNLLKAYAQFEEYRHNISTPQERAGAIQAFEYTYETSWKIIKKILQQESGGKEIYFSKDCFREAAKAGLISNPKAWFDYLNIRNLTVHTYNEDTAQQVTEVFEDFSASLKELIQNIEKLK